MRKSTLNTTALSKKSKHVRMRVGGTPRLKMKLTFIGSSKGTPGQERRISLLWEQMFRESLGATLDTISAAQILHISKTIEYMPKEVVLVDGQRWTQESRKLRQLLGYLVIINGRLSNVLLVFRRVPSALPGRLLEIWNVLFHSRATKSESAFSQSSQVILIYIQL